MSASQNKPSRDTEEAALVAHAIDPEAVRAIMQRNNQRLFRLARSIVRDDAEAEDVVQEAYGRAFTSLGDFGGEASLGTWLGRIVMNETLGRLRGTRPAVELSLLENHLPEAAQIIPFPAASLQLRLSLTISCWKQSAHELFNNRTSHEDVHDVCSCGDGIDRIAIARTRTAHRETSGRKSGCR